MMIQRSLATAAALLALAACDAPLPLAPADLQPRLEQHATGPLAMGIEFTALDLPIAIVDPGTVHLVEGQYLIRGLTLRFRLDATDPRLTGVGTLTANGNLGVDDGEGPVWGSILEFQSDQGDSWAGAWTGNRQRDGDHWTGDERVHMNGVGVDGGKLVAAFTETVTTYTLIPTAYVGAVEGRIDDHP